MSTSVNFSKDFMKAFREDMGGNGSSAATSGSVPAQSGGLTGGRGGGVSLESMLPEPEFSSPAAIRNYCNHLRAVAFGMALEIGMAAEILEATLKEVPDPEGKAFGSKLRARRVARKLRKAAEATTDVAKGAAATHSAFTQEFQEEINRVRHRARPRPRRQIDWADQ